MDRLGAKELLESEIKLSEMKVGFADELLESGTIGQKIDFILSDIQMRESRVLLENKQKLRMREINDEILRQIKI